jgi:hypothetical protein
MEFATPTPLPGHSVPSTGITAANAPCLRPRDTDATIQRLGLEASETRPDYVAALGGTAGGRALVDREFSSERPGPSEIGRQVYHGKLPSNSI